jgi:hypothetical protein
MCFEIRGAAVLNRRLACSPCGFHDGTGETPVQLGFSNTHSAPGDKGEGGTAERQRANALLKFVIPDEVRNLKLSELASSE